MVHLGLVDDFNLIKIFEDSVSSTRELFFGNRWDPTLCPQDGKWFKPFTSALLLLLLHNDPDEIVKLASWCRVDLDPGFSGPENPPEMASLYLIVASSLLPNQIPGIDDRIAEVSKARERATQGLWKIWQAIESGDQGAFEKTLTDSLKHFDSRPKPNNRSTFIGERIARHQSVLALVAMQRGLRLPELPEKLSARLLTRKSIGLE
ncbi:MAG: hypothetical protein ABL888_22695 [Pirellulaceae bacterium]